MKKKHSHFVFGILLALVCSMLPHLELAAQKQLKQDAVTVYKSMLPDWQATDYQMEFRLAQFSHLIGMPPQTGDTSYQSCSIAKSGDAFVSKQGGQAFMLFDSVVVLVDSLQRFVRVIDNPAEVVLMHQRYTATFSPDSILRQSLTICDVSFTHHKENGQEFSTALFVAKQHLEKRSYPVFESKLETVNGLPQRYRILSRSIEMVLEEDVDQLKQSGAMLLMMPASAGKNTHAVIREAVMEIEFTGVAIAPKIQLPVDYKDVLRYDTQSGWQAVGAYAGYVVLNQ